MTTARDKVREELLTDGLADYVDLGAVDSQVTRHNPQASVSAVQRETLETIRSLVSDGLFQLGALSGERGNFVGWDGSLDELIQRVSDVYVTQYDDPPTWVWAVWMELTDKGERVAREIEARSKDSLT
ncbi:hypothetical protein [Mycobacterium kyorinense]|uniref:Uncharacterized protein n=1 Tax=Mycobacterium kyorinense TaxID=487514 RepID=A0A1X1Y0D4_9MYCO|nr:hypothetical protein [Mycobacterium kyorinense]ORW04565.1 hypothetical protein AWC14_03035 [Mycobacterium kyorinense]